VSGQHHAPAALTPGTHCTGGWVDPRAGLDAEARRKILCLCRGSNLGRPVRTLYWLSYPSSHLYLGSSLFLIKRRPVLPSALCFVCLQSRPTSFKCEFCLFPWTRDAEQQCASTCRASEVTTFGRPLKFTIICLTQLVRCTWHPWVWDRHATIIWVSGGIRTPDASGSAVQEHAAAWFFADTLVQRGSVRSCVITAQCNRWRRRGRKTCRTVTRGPDTGTTLYCMNLWTRRIIGLSHTHLSAVFKRRNTIEKHTWMISGSHNGENVSVGLWVVTACGPVRRY
jgi:hypothetical protein